MKRKPTIRSVANAVRRYGSKTTLTLSVKRNGAWNVRPSMHPQGRGRPCKARSIRVKGSSARYCAIALIAAI